MPSFTVLIFACLIFCLLSFSRFINSDSKLYLVYYLPRNVVSVILQEALHSL